MPIEGEAQKSAADRTNTVCCASSLSAPAATRWLTSPNIALGNLQPVSLLSTEVGGRAARQVLLAIEHGLPA
ncbi:antitoxin Xre/MbcA/ParS toxin-binding domain-containing protein [Pseudomonas kuykendallii]|uniref:antitoxin Xre/MbcA/ParS toxin-binding domain-containing protein n=1 Tax=Pseudomonas kuykendallii TaxID=1007099 RepID=UPI003C6E359D